jgi:pre-rRNA-processing protein TSR2
MPASASGGGPLSPQAAAALQEGIGLIFGRWTALQMAVENEWGGRDSRAKADQLAASILSWFTNSRGMSMHSSFPSTSS